MYSTAISRGSKITSALSSLSLKPGNGKLLRRPAQVLRQNPRPNCLFLPRVSPVRKLMTMSQRKIVSETTLKMILMSRSWGWDPVAPSQVPGQLASRSKVGDPV